MGKNLFLESEFAQRPREEALFHVIPVPFEKSVSYGSGTADGPAAILAASDQLEVFDGFSSPAEEGIHTAQPIDCSGTTGQVFDRIAEATARASLEGPPSGGIPVVLGGEHAITAPAVRGILRARELSAKNLGIVQFDAHADLREAYEDNPNSHASVARRLHQDIGTPLVQIGVRAISPEEVLYRATASASKTLWFQDASQIVPAGTTEISLPSEFPREVYITIDVDGLDPSVILATGTPVPGGIPWYQFLALVESVVRQRRVVGFDVVELAPIAGQHAWDYGAAEIVYRTMGLVTRAAAAG